MRAIRGLEKKRESIVQVEGTDHPSKIVVNVATPAQPATPQKGKKHEGEALLRGRQGDIAIGLPRYGEKKGKGGKACHSSQGRGREGRGKAKRVRVVLICRGGDKDCGSSPVVKLQ